MENGKEKEVKKNEKRQLEPNRMIIGKDGSEERYLHTVVDRMLGDTYDDDKGVIIQYPLSREDFARKLLVLLRRCGLRQQGDIKEVEVMTVKTIGNRETSFWYKNKVVLLKHAAAARP